jgi:hypothetical protein
VISNANLRSTVFGMVGEQHFDRRLRIRLEPSG